MSDLILDGHKLAWHRERVEAWLAGERVAPITVDCALGTRCQLFCNFCYASMQTRKQVNLPRDAIMRFLDDAAEIGVKAISLVSDGESTLNPHLYEALLRGKANGLDMALATNGIMLRDDRLEEALPTLTYLRFTICAADPKGYAEIHGGPERYFHKVLGTIRRCVEIKQQQGLPVTLGLQMVLMPHYASQVLPLAKLGRELGVDYLVIKHCSDDEMETLRQRYNFQYSQYQALVPLLKEAEALSGDGYLVAAKWNKILSEGKRRYTRCYGPPLLAQFSGSGLVSPCGMLFPPRFRDFHIGNLVETSFKELWKGERYWQVMRRLATEVNPQTFCGTMCVQHLANDWLWSLKQGEVSLDAPPQPVPQHVNFV
mgnify:CR=1 FL=1